ncbi:hypothetical protein PLESTB_001247700 [Pleodorina starrii]|uniref:Uncharacterized protein n=1 Tax=Pleodorina starrii TaxID=330485 RepID=A0A9W6F5U7_9CHLO|nr:hypothetical protein PLESTM_000212400 [Pleodorina starrii]GLC57628.1 hypothetical protein PLESTB_001247700 [Pleodorina starrii]GLC63295.1 hypothetical protein PLESTF_000021200 [Pleodorina starrii]
MATDTTFDWCSFFALFWNDKGFKCKINIPDTVLFRYGQLSAWWATNKEGYVQRHASHNTTMEAIRRRFIQVAECDEANYSKYVAIVRAADGQPQLLRLQAFNQLTELLSDRLEAGNLAGAPEVDSLQVLQAFVQPHNDFRYVTTYVAAGANNITCHTFQRKYSRRYVAQGCAPPPGADADVALCYGAAGAAAAAALDETPDPVTGQGAVDATLKLEFRKLTSHLVKYIEKAHRLTLSGVVVEWIRDGAGKIYLQSVLRTEWATNAYGNGGGSLSAANLTGEPLDLEDGGGGALPPPPPPPPLPLPPLLDGTDDGGPPVAWAAPPMATNPNGSPIYAPPPSNLAPNRTTLMLVPASASRPSSAYPGGAAGAAGAATQVSELIRPAGVAGMGAGSTMSSLAAFPGGGRAAGLTVTVGNSWPSHQHETQLGGGGLTARSAGAASSSGGALQSLGPGGGGGGYRPMSGATYHTQHSVSASGQYGTGGGGAASGGGGGGGRIQSARSTLAASSVMADRGGGGAAAGGGSGGTRPARPGSSPVAFGRNTNTSPLRSAALVSGPTPGLIPNTGCMPERPASPPGGGASSNRTASPARSRPGTGTPGGGGGSGATGHVNAGTRGAPLMMQQLTRDLEAARDQLQLQNQLAEASAAKVRQLEREKELLVAAFDQRVSELQSSLLVARQDLGTARLEAEEQRKRATEAEARITELEIKTHSLQSTLDGERGTVMTALKECHERDVSIKQRAEQLEAEVTRLTERLKEETTAVSALKRQLLQFSDIAERYATTLKEGEMEPGMQEVLDRVQKLFVGQTNPFGESYAVQKVLNHYHGDLRAVFLYYAQLENNFAAYWPPGLAFQQWMLFCKETETSDPRSNSRVSGVTQPHKMLHPRDCEVVFRSYAKLDPNAINTSAPVLSYEGFLSALIDVAFRVKRFDNPYLSEAVREYILSYVSRASKMSPTGLRRGQVRDALEGTKEGPPPSPGGGSLLTPTKSMARAHAAAAAAAKARKTATIAASVQEYPLVRTMTGLIRTTTGTSAGGSLAASRPGSALSRQRSAHTTNMEQDLALEYNASANRVFI